MVGKPVTTQPVYVAVLAEALTAKLKGAEVRTERVRGERYLFEVLWRKFDHMGHPERQQLVWDLAEEVLSKPQVRRVAMILTVAPAELATR